MPANIATLAEAVADCALVVGTTPADLARWSIPFAAWTGRKGDRAKTCGTPVALLFGSEKFGLSNEDMSHCHWLLRIPTREEHGSMNLGQSVAVCLYEIIRQPSAARATAEAAQSPQSPRKAEDLERSRAVSKKCWRIPDTSSDRWKDRPPEDPAAGPPPGSDAA